MVLKVTVFFMSSSKKTEVAFIQFERHWPELSAENQVVKNDYINKLSTSFIPPLHLSVISSSGQILASSLTNLSQLSYGHIVAQFQEQFALGQPCLKQLYSLLEEPVQACAYPYNDEVILISTLENKTVFQYWLQKKIYLIFASLFSLLLVTFIIYLSHRQKVNSIFDQRKLENDITKQDNDFKRLVSNLPVSCID